MKKSAITILFFLAMAGIQTKSFAQHSDEVNQAAKEGLSQLSFLVGKWKGSGWMISQDRSRHTFEQTETIQFKLSETAILVEGLGTSEGKVIHNAMAVITFNEKQGNFDFSSYLQNGQKGIYPGELANGIFTWQPTPQVRFVIQINEKGQWFEVGEYNTGDQWYKFFEMTLDKIQ